MSSETGKSNYAQDVHHNNAADNKGEFFTSRKQLGAITQLDQVEL